MSNATSAAKDSFLGSQHLQNLYIPAGILVFGTALLNYVYFPYVALAALVIGGFQVLKGRKYQETPDVSLRLLIKVTADGSKMAQGRC